MSVNEEKGELLKPEQLATIAENESNKIALTIETNFVKIKNAQQLEEANEALGNIKRMSKNIKEQKDPIIKDLNASLKRIRELFKPAETRLDEAERKIKAAIIDYSEREAAKAAKKAAKIEEKLDNEEITSEQALKRLEKVEAPTNSFVTKGAQTTIRVTKDIKIIDVASLPAQYFLRPDVVEALRKEVKKDVLRNGLPLPAGAEIIEIKNASVSV